MAFDWSPYWAEIDDCWCDLHREQYGAHVSGLGPLERATNAIKDALTSGMHQRRELPARLGKGRGYTSSGSMSGGIGAGMTPGGVPGSEYYYQRLTSWEES